MRVALLVGLVAAFWMVYRWLPADGSSANSAKNSSQTTVQVILRRSPNPQSAALDIPVEISPVDIVAVRHEFFVEPRAGKRFDDFLHERMNGRSAITGRLDEVGRATLAVPGGTWWIHAILPGDEDLEWRLNVTISGEKQTIELTPENAYTRSKSF